MSTFGVVLSRVAAFGTMAFGVFGVLFAGGYALDDPGGWAAAGMIALMVVPAVGITLLAVRRPEHAIVLVYLGLGLLVAYTVADAVSHLVGAPLIPLTALVLAFPVAFLGLHRPRTAGRLLFAIGAVPILGAVLVAILRSDEGGLFVHLGGSSGAAAIPLVVFALLFLVAGSTTPGRQGHSTPTPTETPDRTPVAH